MRGRRGEEGRREKVMRVEEMWSCGRKGKEWEGEREGKREEKKSQGRKVERGGEGEVEGSLIVVR